MGDVDRYQASLVGPIERFDQMNEMFKRGRFEPEWAVRANAFFGHDREQEKNGYTHEFFALTDASWYLEDYYACGCAGSDLEGLYS
jgi:hypothetical protein